MCDQPRLFLPPETLEKLSCSECTEYLRYGPIKVKLDGESVCGKCASNRKHAAPLIHNKAFEEVAKLVYFPCKYRKFGCPQSIGFDDTTNHEESCVFHTYHCPADLVSCAWNGTASQLPHHYRVNHQDLFMPTSTFEVHMNESTQETKLYVQQNLSFLVKFKVSKKDGKFWIKVEHLSDESRLTSVTYNLTLHTTEEDGLRMLMKERSIQCISSFSTFDIKDSQCVDINSLLTILEAPPTVFCSVDIKIPAELAKEIRSTLEGLKCPYCSSYMAPPIFVCPEGHSSCEDCIGYNRKCRRCNKDNTDFNRHSDLEVISASCQLPCRWPHCDVILDYSTIRIHEKNCQHKRHKCPRCYNWHGTEMELKEHFCKDHDTHPLHFNKKISVKGDVETYDFYVLVFGNIFGCSVFPTSEDAKNFSLWYYGLPSFHHKYEYSVQIQRNIDDVSEVVETYKLEKCQATQNCFSFNLKLSKEDLERYEDLDKLYFVFEIDEKS